MSCSAQQTSLVKNTQQILANEKILRLAEDGSEELNSQEDSCDKLVKKSDFLIYLFMLHF